MPPIPPARRWRSSRAVLHKGFWALAALVLLPACASTTPKESIKRIPAARYQENVYVTGRGETLDDIAKKFDVPVDALKKTNKLESDTITEGQRLEVPNAKSGAFLEDRKPAPPNIERKVRPPVKPLAPPAGKAPRIAEALSWPVKGTVTSNFGIRSNGKHDGIDISAPAGTEIHAAADGVVIFSGWGPSGYGNIVVIRHSETLVTVYAHNKENAVKRGSAVRRGDKIALVGASGRATSPHCHFEVRLNRMAYDPLDYLEKR